MSLLEEIEKMKAEIAKGEEKEDSAEEIVEEQPEEQPEEQAVEEVKEEQEEAKEEKKEEALKEEKQLDDAGWARLRREAAAEKRRAEQLEKELQELRKSKEVEAAEEETQPIQIPQEFQSVIEDHQLNRARREFTMFESQVKQQHPEYGAVASEYAAAMYQSIRLQNPRKSAIELNEMTERAILLRASEYARKGYENPVEEMYHEAKELGFTGKSMIKQEPEAKEEKLQPDMRKVAENRKRSTGMAATHGRSEGLMTVAHAATELTAAEWAKLPKADKQRLLYGR